MRDDTFGDDDNRKPAATIEGEGLSRDLEKGDVEPPAYDREHRSRAKHSHKKRNHHQSRQPKGALPTNGTGDEMMIAAENRLSFAPASSGTSKGADSRHHEAGLPAPFGFSLSMMALKNQSLPSHQPRIPQVKKPYVAEMSELPPVPKSTPSPHRQEGGDDGAMPLPPAVKPGAVAVPGIRAETTGDDVSFTPSNQSMQPVEAVAVEDDLKRRNDLESQLEQVLRERENAVVAQVVDVNEESQQIDSKFCGTRTWRLVAVAAIVAAIALIAAVVPATRPRSSARDELNNAQTDNTTSAAPIPVPTLPSEQPFHIITFYATAGRFQYRDLDDLEAGLPTLPKDQGNAFMIHLGDWNSPVATNCSAQSYADNEVLYNTSSVPVLFVPGDNEYNDCPKCGKAV